MRIHPTIKILYILAVSTVVFVFNNVWVTLGLLGLQIVLWFATQIPLKKLKPLRKVITFALMLVFFHTFFSGNNDIELFWKIGVSKHGALVGALMVAKLMVMLLATFVVRNNTEPEEFMRGLQGLGLSKNSAQILDSMFQLEQQNKGKKGKGGGGGGGRGGGSGKGRKKDKGDGKVITIKEVLKGNFSGIPEFVNQRLDASKSKFSNPDVGLIAAFSTMVMLVRFLKIAPGFPIAPGHKNVLLVPLFILGARSTKTPFAASTIGFLSGIVHFSFGFGKYGPLGILQFALMGFVIDLMMLIFPKSNSVFVFGFVGLIAGLTRVSAEITLAWILGMPLEYYLLYSPYIISQCVFGASSAIVTKYLINRIN